MLGNLFSGVVGSFVTLLLAWAYAWYERRQEYQGLLKSIAAECDYNISIIDEILEGVVNANGSFKRLSVDYFRAVREAAAKYSYPDTMVRTLSRVIVDMDLFNMEVNYVFDGQVRQYVYAGTLGSWSACLVQKTIGNDISATIRRARDGVVDSLQNLKRLASEPGNEEE